MEKEAGLWRELKEVIFMYLTKAEFLIIVLFTVTITLELTSHPLKGLVCASLALALMFIQAIFNEGANRSFGERGND